MSASLVPIDNNTVYIVLNDFGELGRAYVETDEAEADEQTVIRNILSGVYSNPQRVVAFNTDCDWSHDVTKSIATAVRERALARGYISTPAREFVERVLGKEVEIGR